MTGEDIPQVAAIERLCFSMPWPTSAYRRELKTPETNRYIVVRYVPPEDAASLPLPRPTIENLTNLNHPALHHTNGHSHVENTGSRSWLDALLPWRRNASSRYAEDGEGLTRYPIVGYAGLWLMVDEADVTTIG